MIWFKRFLGISSTPAPKDHACWKFSGYTIEIDLQRAPELAQPGGALRLEEKGLPQRMLVVRLANGNVRAFHNRCSHMRSRRLDPIPGTNHLCCCSRQGSRFDENGKVIKGPAHSPIAVYDVEVSGAKAFISLR
jgi:nitrite reductase/ring-hydroxylating ferredoxin subunit